MDFGVSGQLGLAQVHPSSNRYRIPTVPAKFTNKKRISSIFPVQKNLLSIFPDEKILEPGFWILGLKGSLGWNRYTSAVTVTEYQGPRISEPGLKDFLSPFLFFSFSFPHLSSLFFGGTWDVDLQRSLVGRTCFGTKRPKGPESRNPASKIF